MKHLLLLIAALLIVPTASAQWVFDGNWPAGDASNTPHIHGLGVTPDGNVWVMPYYPFTGDSVAVSPPITNDPNDCNATTGNCRVVALYAYEPDGDLASFAPLSIVTLPGGEQDTLGGERRADGAGWDYNSGRGLRVGLDGKVYASFFNTLYKIDTDGTILDVAQPQGLNGASLTSASTDSNGDVYITSVAPNNPLVKMNSSLDFIENVTDVVRAFNRKVFAMPDGNTVIAPNYSQFIATIYTRPDDLTPYDSSGVTFEGMSVESIAIHPTTGRIWASSGPSASGVPTGGWDDGMGNSGSYTQNTWYEFTVDQVMNNRSPVPSDSINWNNPDGVGKPRALAFSPDGEIAYVGQFDQGAPALQKFVFAGTSVAEGPQVDGVTLHQNVPNPFGATTDISFDLEEPMALRVVVHDVTGREVAVLASGMHRAGTHTVTFHAGNLAGGIYVFSLESGGQSTSRRMLHMR